MTGAVVETRGNLERRHRLYGRATQYSEEVFYRSEVPFQLVLSEDLGFMASGDD